MKISVIIPVYKVEPYIRQCIESVMAQTMTDIEIIVVNDGTPDRSAEIAKEYAAKDSRIKVIDQENQGVSAARNAGLRAASAPLVMFVDSDDWVTPDYCQKMFDALTDDVDVVICDTRIIDERGREIPNFFAKNIEESMIVWNKIFRLDIIRTHGIEFPVGCIHEDEYFWATYLPWCRDSVVLPDKLYVHLRYSDSIMGRWRTQHDERVNSDYLRILAALGDYYYSHGLMRDPQWSAHYWRKFDKLIRSAQGYRPKKKKKFKKLRDFFKHTWRKLTGYYKRHGL